MPIIKHDIFINAPINVCFDLARNVDVHKETTSKTETSFFDFFITISPIYFVIISNYNTKVYKNQSKKSRSFFEREG